VRTHAAAQARPRRHRRIWLVLPALVGLVALAGCGGSSSSSTKEAAPAPTPTVSTSTTTSSAPASGASNVSLSANPSGQLEYNTKSLSAKAGKVTIAFTNQAPLGHDVAVESSSGQQVGATPVFSGGSKTLSLELKPGTYKFFCTVPGHRQAGMEGTLTVQ